MSRVELRRAEARRDVRADEQARDAESARGASITVRGARVPVGATDLLERAVSTLPAVQAQQSTPLASGGSPFAVLGALGEAQVLPLRWEVSTALDHDVSPSREMLGRMASCEAAALRHAKADGAASRLSTGAARIRLGMMLSLSDGVEAQCRQAGGVPREAVTRVAEKLTVLDAPRLPEGMGQLIGAQRSSFPFGMDVTAYVQAVLRESYLIQCEILRDYGARADALNDLQKRIRAKMDRVRRMLLDHEDGDPLPPDFVFELFGEAGREWRGGDEEGADGDEGRESASAWQVGMPVAARNDTARPPRILLDPMKLAPALFGAQAAGQESAPVPGSANGTFSKAEMEAYLDALEEDLKTVGGDSQLANNDLQEALQKQQQALQMMSNISKLMHDIAMAIIRNIGG